MKELTDSAFSDFVNQKKTVVIDFWASWCGPCRVASPIFEELSKDFVGKIEFAKMNVDDNPETSSKYQIFSIPTFLVFKDGEQIGSITGAYPKLEFKRKLEEFL